ncbi:hypothetical protein BDP27DRAFT_1428444 [Rhodocollybia butyracea]|uniref:Uncharacterized protein n=1 Tax=Rhodocollybia butyracea TaxID=206335 RepID=A0A9P5PEL8_9AGAR|nr:hypothetical protein BDP27DRAFT_1428444 [Rhodocollybia butyracea]
MPMLPLAELLNPAPEVEPQSSSLCETASYKIETNVTVTQKCTVVRLYTYKAGTTIKYPKTTEQGSVGHLFELDPEDWVNPSQAFAYSQGEPKGFLRNRFCCILLDDQGESVPCYVRHSTCQGCKACSFADKNLVSVGHTTANCSDLANQLKQYSQHRQLELPTSGSVTKDLFEKTLALWNAFQNVGCSAPLNEDTLYLGEELEARKVQLAIDHDIRRGHTPKPTCQGRVILDYDSKGTPYVHCEHYRSATSHDHLVNYDISSGLYDFEYLRALFTNDTEELELIEDGAQDNGYGPLALCSTITNASSQHVSSALHRNSSGQLVKAKLDRIECTSRIRACTLTQFPSDQNTPGLRREILALLQSLGQDLPDITPPPSMQNPMLSDLHISLANQDHLRAYITQAQEISFPYGTGWAGVIYAKQLQDSNVPVSQHYIWLIKEYELEDDELDLDSSIVYCRVYVNRQTAVAHHRIFSVIDDIVFADTGTCLKWRHLHGMDLNDFCGILHFAGDQHGGQAKGLGLHLLARSKETPEKYDLHKPRRLLSSLLVYKHLHRVFRLCDAHFKRNITKCKVPDEVKQKMQSLSCISHPNFEQTVQEIRSEGGKAGVDWVSDKYRSHFAFEAICWEKSFIPAAIWQVGDSTMNIIEGLHANINLEGVLCTLLGGLQKGQHYNNMKYKMIEACVH